MIPKGTMKRTFVFSDNVPWSSASGFDKDLADFFKSKGLVATLIQAPDGEILDRSLWIEKAQEEVLSAVPSSMGKSSDKPKSVIQALKAANSSMMKGRK